MTQLATSLANADTVTSSPCTFAHQNKAIGLIQDAIASGPFGGSYMVMDACGPDATPDTVAATRLPPWSMPTMPARLRDKLRPDILIIEGLPLHLQCSCRIHIIKVGYCSGSSSRWLQARPLKKCNTSRLCSALRDAGWVLAQPPAADPDMPVAAALPSACRYSVIMLGCPQAISAACARCSNTHA